MKFNANESHENILLSFDAGQKYFLLSAHVIFTVWQKLRIENKDGSILGIRKGDRVDVRCFSFIIINNYCLNNITILVNTKILYLFIFLLYNINFLNSILDFLRN